MNNANSLIVYFNKEIVGELQLTNVDRYEFQYQDSWLKDNRSFPISLALKLQTEPHDHVTTKSFFEGLIPEEDVLRHLKRGLLDTTTGDVSPWSILARFYGRRKTITF